MVVVRKYLSERVDNRPHFLIGWIHNEKYQGDTMNKAVKITTQYLENYGDEVHPHYKYKGGDTYFVPFETEKLIYEEDCYGPGEHSYYEAPDVSQATVDALVMQYMNAYNGLEFAFSYITNSEVVSVYDMEWEIDAAEEWKKPQVITVADLNKGIAETRTLKEKHEFERVNGLDTPTFSEKVDNLMHDMKEEEHFFNNGS